MNAVITLGIDMSSQPKGTAACAVTWEADRAVTVTPCLGCDDEILSEMIAKSDAVGIDAPFGWPAVEILEQRPTAAIRSVKR
jgi:predicted nuclease with RNAse H fold